MINGWVSGPFPWLAPEVLDRATRGGGKLEGESEEWENRR